ncbi:MAG: cyclic nucleotide-binding domain-containing protein [Actinobacteria bacterium]|nr:MAG: cyclic nucleotide-binding domain-containing protein [Actinomycetota bacterium]
MRTTLTEARRDLLRRVPLFAACTDKELATVAALVDDIEVEPGEVVVEEGVPGRDSFIVVAGRAEVSLRGKVIARLEPGDFFGEMSLLTHRLRTATVTPITPMRLLVVELRNFMGLLEVGGVAKVMLRTVVERLRLAQDLSSTGG